MVAAGTWFLIFPRHLAIVFWSPETLEKEDGKEIESSNAQEEGNGIQEEGNDLQDAEGINQAGGGKMYDRPAEMPTFKLRRNHVDKVYPLTDISDVVVEDNVFARHQQGVTGCCQARFTPPVPGLHIQGKGVEGDIIHRHVKDPTVRVNGKLVSGDIIGSMASQVAETKRLEMPSPTLFAEALRRQQQWAKANPEKRAPKQQKMTSASGAESSSSEKLAELQKMRQQDLITEEEFQQRKKAILDGLVSVPGTATQGLF